MANDEVVALIKSICLEPFLDYGADRMCLELKNRGLIINKKKVYRLMKEGNLLFPKKASSGSVFRKRVVSSSPCPSFPFEVIEIDIKYIYIHGANRNAYLLTALDTFTRIAMAWRLDYKMKAKQVAELTQSILESYPSASVEGTLLRIRTDNGPQFISKILHEAIENLPFEHEFIQPRTPQQNGHIESFHHTVSKLVTSSYEFEDLEQANKIFTQFYEVYNNKRIKEELLGKSPVQFYQLWQKNEIGVKHENKQTKFFFKEKPSQSNGSPSEDVLVALQTNNLNQLNSTPIPNSV
jgi:transposase InsO family protein